MRVFCFIRDCLKRNRALVESALPRLFAILILPPFSYGYTVLTHEAIMDSVWDSSLQNMLLKRFPNATPEELETAHGYAYAGSIIQDMGYYPFSSRPGLHARECGWRRVRSGWRGR